MTRYRFHFTVDGVLEPVDDAGLQLQITIGPPAEQNLEAPTPEDPHMITLTATQQVPISIAAVDAKGNPAALDSVAFESSDADVATVEQDTVDPSKATVVADKIGTAQIQVTADADLGEGVRNIRGVLDVTVVAGEAVSLSVTAGTPTEQP